MKSSELLRKLQKAGWVIQRQTGSHLIMRHPDHENPIIYPSHSSKEVGTGLGNSILKQAGLK